MSTPLRSLLLGFGIEVTGKEKLDKVDGTVDSILKKVQRLGAGLASVFIVKQLATFITDTIESGRNLDLQAEKLGLTTEELERYRYAAGMAGVDTAKADLALQMFNRQLGEAEVDSKAARKGVAALGGGYTAAQLAAMPLQEVLQHIADKMATMTDKGAKTQLMMKLFGRQGAALIPMMDGLGHGAKWMTSEFDDLGGGMGDFAQRAKETGDGIKRLTFVWGVLSTRLVGAVLPAITKLVTWITKSFVSLEWLEKHSYLAQTALIALCAAAVIAFAPFLASILPIVAAMGLLYLMFDDFYTMMMGGQSILGDFIDALFGKGAHETFVTDVKTKFQEFIDWLNTDGIKGVKEFGTAISEAFTNALPYIRNAFYMVRDFTRELRAGFGILKGLQTLSYDGTGEAAHALKNLTQGSTRFNADGSVNADATNANESHLWDTVKSGFYQMGGGLHDMNSQADQDDQEYIARKAAEAAALQVQGNRLNAIAQAAAIRDPSYVLPAGSAMYSGQTVGGSSSVRPEDAPGFSQNMYSIDITLPLAVSSQADPEEIRAAAAKGAQEGIKAAADEIKNAHPFNAAAPVARKSPAGSHGTVP